MVNLQGILKERHKTHGTFEDNAKFSDHLREFMRTFDGYYKLTITQREALSMIMVKVSRILSGDPNHSDSWVDIAGFAELAQSELQNKLGPIAHEQKTNDVDLKKIKISADVAEFVARGRESHNNLKILLSMFPKIPDYRIREVLDSYTNPVQAVKELFTLAPGYNR